MSSNVNQHNYKDYIYNKNNKLSYHVAFKRVIKHLKNFVPRKNHLFLDLILTGINR